MNQSDPSHTSERSGWRPMGEIMLTVNPDRSETIHSSLHETLAPLQLPMDLIQRVEKSIREILERAVAKQTGLEHVHLFLYVPASYNAQMGTWGFFRIERIDAEAFHASRSHAVDLYLYPE